MLHQHQAGLGAAFCWRSVRTSSPALHHLRCHVLVIADRRGSTRAGVGAAPPTKASVAGRIVGACARTASGLIGCDALLYDGLPDRGVVVWAPCDSRCDGEKKRDCGKVAARISRAPAGGRPRPWTGSRCLARRSCPALSRSDWFGCVVPRRSLDGLYGRQPSAKTSWTRCRRSCRHVHRRREPRPAMRAAPAPRIPLQRPSCARRLRCYADDTRHPAPRKPTRTGPDGHAGKTTSDPLNSSSPPLRSSARDNPVYREFALNSLFGVQITSPASSFGHTNTTEFFLRAFALSKSDLVIHS